MERELSGNKPRINVGTIGHANHGKTTLTNAIQMIAKQKDVHETQTVSSYVEYETEKNRYVHKDCPGHVEYIKSMISGAVRMDAAILVVSAEDGLMQQTREHILLAKYMGVSHIIVFINKCDVVVDDAQIEEVETEVKKLLENYGFSVKHTPIIRGAALSAWREPRGKWRESIVTLLDAMDASIPNQTEKAELPLFLFIEESFCTRKNTIAKGIIKRGGISLGEEIDIIGFSPEKKSAVVEGIRVSGIMTNHAVAGDEVEIFLGHQSGFILERGQVMAAAGTVDISRSFRAEIYVLCEEEGGSRNAVCNKASIQFFFGTTDVTGSLTLLGADSCMPGECVTAEIALVVPVAMENGLRFAIREGGKTIGVGSVATLCE